MRKVIVRLRPLPLVSWLPFVNWSAKKVELPGLPTLYVYETEEK